MGRIIRAFLLVMLGYLTQACIMPYLDILSITPNVLFSVIAVITVAYGRFFTFGVAGMAGIITEVMAAGVPNLNLILYPAIGMLGGLAFADKSERRREQERSQGRTGVDLDARIRTALCVLFNMAWFEAVHLLFIYLSGAQIGWVQLGRAFGSIVYTLFITILILWPARRFLGLRASRQGGAKDRAAKEVT